MKLASLLKYIGQFFGFREKKTYHFTLALGGGGARGLAHIGVLRALEKAGIIPTAIVGTSMGAVVGAMYCQIVSSDKVEDKIRNFLGSKYFKHIGLEEFDNKKDSSISIWERFLIHLRHRFFLTKSILGTGMFAQSALIDSLKLLMEDTDIASLPIKFAAVTCDLISGEEIVFTTGPLIQAVAASSAVPGVVAPISIDKYLLIDGTVSSNIPVLAAKELFGSPVIAVDVRHRLGSFAEPKHGYEVILRSNDITNYRLNNLYLEQADVIIKAKVDHIEWNEFSKIDECIVAGEKAAEEKIRSIRKILYKTNTYQLSREVKQ